uniref:Uncharacterized protein n=1 Tax=Arundo donax TaxID=35708 RepID=A0A0A8ZVL5_ARUDO
MVLCLVVERGICDFYSIFLNRLVKPSRKGTD